MPTPARSAPSLRPSLPALGGLIACAACCAAPLVLPALLGAGATTGLGAWLFARGEWIGLVVLIAGAALAVGLRRARAQAPACATDGSCGCARPSTEAS